MENQQTNLDGSNIADEFDEDNRDSVQAITQVFDNDEPGVPDF